VTNYRTDSKAKNSPFEKVVLQLGIKSNGYILGMSQSRPAIEQTLQNNVQNLRENPENLSSKKRLLYEIEQLLQMPSKDLELEALNQTSGRVTISNRALYKIFKALCQEKQVEPSLVYTGNSYIEKTEAEKLVRETEKTFEDLELTI